MTEDLGSVCTSYTQNVKHIFVMLNPILVFKSLAKYSVVGILRKHGVSYSNGEGWGLFG
jgi:hypothetical protein